MEVIIRWAVVVNYLLTSCPVWRGTLPYADEGDIIRQQYPQNKKGNLNCIKINELLVFVINYYNKCIYDSYYNAML